MRHRRVLCAAALLAAVGAFPAAADAQRVNPVLRSPAAPIATRLGVLVGSLTDPSSGPIAEAEVSVLSTDVRVRSNAEGRFRFIDVPLGQHLLVVRRSGFRSLAAVVELGRADTLQLRYTLEPARDENPAAASGPPPARGPRFLLTRDEIARRGLASSAGYVALAPDVTLVRVPNALGLTDLVAVNAGRPRAVAGDPDEGCALAVMIDEVEMPPRLPLSLLPAPGIIERIEVITATATACGRIVIRTGAGGP